MKSGEMVFGIDSLEGLVWNVLQGIRGRNI